MKIEKPGFYRTRDGQKVEIAAINQNATAHSRCIGWVNGMIFACSTEGSLLTYSQHNSDIVSEWTDPVHWDWNLCAWVNTIAMDSDGEWYGYTDVPTQDIGVWTSSGGTNSSKIPQSHYPKWSGDWKQSLTVRPGYKENSK